MANGTGKTDKNGDNYVIVATGDSHSEANAHLLTEISKIAGVKAVSHTILEDRSSSPRFTISALVISSGNPGTGKKFKGTIVLDEQ